MRKLNTTYYKSNKIALYYRLSVADGDAESESIKNQRKQLRLYMENHNLTYVDEYIDDGVSGMTFDRPDFNRLMQDIEKGRINTIITKSLERLGRDSNKVGFYVEKYFPEHRIRYLALNDNVDTAIECVSSDLILKIGFNDFYPYHASDNIKAVIYSKRQKGDYLSSFAPYGYIKDPADHHHLIIDDSSSKIIKRIFELYINNNSANAIADILTSEHISTPARYRKTGNLYETDTEVCYKWDKSFILNTIQNKVYLGCVLSNKYIKVSLKSKKSVRLDKKYLLCKENRHEPIIDKCTFDMANTVRLNKKMIAKDVHKAHHRFTLFGYTHDSSDYYSLVIDEKVAYIVHEIFDLYEQGYGYRNIAEICNDRNYITPKCYLKTKGSTTFKDVWTPDKIKCVLKNPSYYGCNVRKINGTKVITPNCHIPLIDKAQFDHVQELMKIKHKQATPLDKPILYKFLYCGCCGRKMQVTKITEKRKKLNIYCPAEKVKHIEPCSISKRFITYLDIEKQVTSRLHRLSKYVQSSEFEKKVEQIYLAPVASHVEERNRLEKELEIQMHKIDMIYSDRANNMISDTLFFDKIKEYQRSVISLNKQLDIERNIIFNYKQKSEEILDEAEILKNIFESKNFIERFLNEIISKINVTDTTIEIVYKIKNPLITGESE